MPCEQCGLELVITRSNQQVCQCAMTRGGLPQAESFQWYEWRPEVRRSFRDIMVHGQPRQILPHEPFQIQLGWPGLDQDLGRWSNHLIGVLREDRSRVRPARVRPVSIQESRLCTRCETGTGSTIDGLCYQCWKTDKKLQHDAERFQSREGLFDTETFQAPPEGGLFSTFRPIENGGASQ